MKKNLTDREPYKTDKPASVNQGATTVPRYESHILFKGADRVVINHQGESYLLRITRNGKLILTK